MTNLLVCDVTTPILSVSQLPQQGYSCKIQKKDMYIFMSDHFHIHNAQPGHHLFIEPIGFCDDSWQETGQLNSDGDKIRCIGRNLERCGDTIYTFEEFNMEGCRKAPALATSSTPSSPHKVEDPVGNGGIGVLGEQLEHSSGKSAFAFTAKELARYPADRRRKASSD